MLISKDLPRGITSFLRQHLDDHERGEFGDEATLWHQSKEICQLRKENMKLRQQLSDN